MSPEEDFVDLQMALSISVSSFHCYNSLLEGQSGEGKTNTFGQWHCVVCNIGAYHPRKPA